MLVNSEPISEDLGHLALRLAFGGTMLWQHGWPKLMQFTERMDNFADPLGIGPLLSLVLIVLAEVVCAALITLGMWTRAACIPLIIAMSVAVFMVHGDDAFGDKELAILYLVGYIAILLTGSGRFAINRLSFN
ncbi:MAG: DoxX family protein [Flavobacteriales bacterium]